MRGQDERHRIVEHIAGLLVLVLTRWMLVLAVLAGAVGAARADEDPGERVAFGALWWVRYPPREHTGWAILRESAHRGPIDPARLPRLWSHERPCSVVEEDRLPSGVRQVLFTCEVSSRSFFSDALYSLIEHPSGTYLLTAAVPGHDDWAREVIRSLEPREPPDELVVGPFVFPREIAAGSLESFHPDNDFPTQTVVALVTPLGVPGPSVDLTFGSLTRPDGKRGARGPKVRLFGRLIETFPPRDGSLPLGVSGLCSLKFNGVRLTLSARSEEELRISIQILESMRYNPAGDPCTTTAHIISLGPPPLRKGRWVMSKRRYPRY